ncbi:TolC family protein [Ideonella sp. NS12-5]|uniref:TolC family protein n=1 Tax=Ideonella oryzae TaxID=2937441 RepID=A0ABT1BGR5_9BURK|nr:TolC family protein [Ideonella oryzae]
MFPIEPTGRAWRPPVSRRRRGLRLSLSALSLAVLAGCATFSGNGGMDEVAALTQARTGQTPQAHGTDTVPEAVQARVQALLAQPLGADQAVELALIQQPGLQARFDELAQAEAERVRAGRLPNPVLSLGRLAGGGALEVDRALTVDLLGWLAWPVRDGVAERQWRSAQWQAAVAAVGQGLAARQAWVDAVAVQQQLALQDRLQAVADTAAELVQAMARAGNVPALTQLREQAFQTETRLQGAQARQAALAARERLVRALGLDADAPRLSLPEHLPALPNQPRSLSEAEQAAIDQRLDVQMARLAAEATAQDLGLSRATSWVNVLEAGVQDKHARGEPTQRGAELTLELPLFDFGSTRRADAEARYRQALHRTAQVALEARSEVREAYAAYRSAYDAAQVHSRELLPLRQKIADEMLLRYNGMLIGTSELLDDARSRTAAASAALAAQRAFWQADARLQAALAGVPTRAADAADLAASLLSDAPATAAAGH